MKRLVLGCLLATSCVPGAALRLEHETLVTRAEAARETGAARCAPVELARAETELEFLALELAQGDSVRASDHRDEARRALVVVVDKVRACQPPEEEGEVPVALAPVDTDGDGVPDETDACVTAPGPVEFQGCPDKDGDRIPDHRDTCPDAAEDYDQHQDEDGCPETEDRDGDGLLDVVDACPETPGKPEHKGCPLADKDGDGLADESDKCPAEAEDVDRFQDEDGCPDLDNDGDGIPDAQDKCSDLPETQNSFQDDDGCPDINPDLVVLNRDTGKIDIKQKVYFDTGRDRVKAISYAVLNEVAVVLKATPELEIDIEGHTDSVGNDATNLRLSQKRAEAVRDHLIQQGVEAHRMRAIGYGEAQPIDTNRTKEGREINRRVEFTIKKG